MLCEADSMKRDSSKKRSKLKICPISVSARIAVVMVLVTIRGGMFHSHFNVEVKHLLHAVTPGQSRFVPEPDLYKLELMLIPGAALDQNCFSVTEKVHLIGGLICALKLRFCR